MKTIKLIFVAAAVLSVTGLYFADVYFLSHKLAAKDGFWTIFTAIGTMLAAIVALFFGVGQQIQNRREAVTRAKIVAARLAPLLTRCRDDSLKLREQLASKNREFAILDVRSFVFEPTRDFNRAAFAAVLNGQLEPLAALPNDCALRLARGVSLLESTINEILEFDDLRSVFPRSREDGEAKLDTWHRCLDEGCELLIAALDTCTAAARDVIAH